jgi:hypothetical protein
VINQGRHKDEIKNQEGLPVEDFKVEGMIQEVEPQACQGRVKEAIHLSLGFETLMLFL